MGTGGACWDLPMRSIDGSSDGFEGVGRKSGLGALPHSAGAHKKKEKEENAMLTRESLSHFYMGKSGKDLVKSLSAKRFTVNLEVPGPEPPSPTRAAAAAAGAAAEEPGGAGGAATTPKSPTAVARERSRQSIHAAAGAVGFLKSIDAEGR